MDKIIKLINNFNSVMDEIYTQYSQENINEEEANMQLLEAINEMFRECKLQEITLEQMMEKYSEDIADVYKDVIQQLEKALTEEQKNNFYDKLNPELLIYVSDTNKKMQQVNEQNVFEVINSLEEGKKIDAILKYQRNIN